MGRAWAPDPAEEAAAAKARALMAEERWAAKAAGVPAVGKQVCLRHTITHAGLRWHKGTMGTVVWAGAGPYTGSRYGAPLAALVAPGWPARVCVQVCSGSRFFCSGAAVEVLVGAGP